MSEFRAIVLGIFYSSKSCWFCLIVSNLGLPYSLDQDGLAEAFQACPDLTDAFVFLPAPFVAIHLFIDPYGSWNTQIQRIWISDLFYSEWIRRCS